MAGVSFLACFICLVASTPAASGRFDRCSFPKGFIFGTASAAYQYEGAASEDWRKPCIWDTFSHTQGKVEDGKNGDTAADHYHRYPDDIQLMKNMGMDAFRFSISWSRIYPDGDGNLEFLITTTLSTTFYVKPFVTLYHWDMPQALEDRFGGWLSPNIVDRFAWYAEACFYAFGDRVKHWITFNEPLSFVAAGYGSGTVAPGRCTYCSKGGNSSSEPYIAGHHVLLSHAAAVRVYRQKYQAQQRGEIGITLNSNWYEPMSNSSADLEASERALAFDLGWFLDPIMFGDYPKALRDPAGARLPTFTEEESWALKGSIDFLGLNHYTSRYSQASKFFPSNQATNYYQDSGVANFGEFYKHVFIGFNTLEASRNGVLIGPQAASTWLYIVPWGFDKLVTYIARHYNNPVIYITENGVDENDNSSFSLQEALEDGYRIKYYLDYISSLLQAIRKGADVRGYFAWSLIDNFEWGSGYTVRFGLHYVDFRDNLKRYPKASALWFRQFLISKC